MTLLTALTLVSGHHLRSEDVVIGVSTSNRNRTEVQALIGFFNNQLLLRTSLTGNPSFTDLLRRVRRTVLEADAHQDLPFERLIQEISPARTGRPALLYDIKFGWQPEQAAPFEIPGLQLESFGSSRTPERCPLFLDLFESEGGIGGGIFYDVEVFEGRVVTLFEKQLQALLQSIVDRPTDKESIDHMLDDMKLAHEAPRAEEIQQERAARWKNIRRTKEAASGQAPVVELSSASLVRTSSIAAGSVARAIEPAINDIDLCAWAEANQEFIDQSLIENGAILFRNFPIKCAAEFQQFVSAVAKGQMSYDEPTTPRSRVADKIYTSTDYPPDQSIPPHNERSYSAEVPMRLYFWCDTPAAVGGETPLGDSRRIYQRIPKVIRDRFEETGWMYVRNFSAELGLSWQTVFQTEDRNVVEEYCRTNSIDFDWKAGERLTTRQVRPAVIVHPRTGEPSWFNHITFFHISSLEPVVRERLLADYGEAGVPNNTYYGDGSRIEESVLDEMRQAYEREMAGFAWQRGDLVMLDNLLVAHARKPFSGPRKILFAMSNPYRRPNVVSRV
jgi:alpha-ketoglutarate-dependent taurine dioxygenase